MTLQTEQISLHKMRRNEQLYHLERLYVEEIIATKYMKKIFDQAVQDRLRSFSERPKESKSLCVSLLTGLTDKRFLSYTLINDGHNCKIQLCGYPHSFASYFANHIAYHKRWRTTPCPKKEACLYKAECNYLHPGLFQRIILSDNSQILQVYEPEVSNSLKNGYAEFLKRMPLEHREPTFLPLVKKRLQDNIEKQTKPKMCMPDEISECLGSRVCSDAHTAAEYLADALAYSKFWKTEVCLSAQLCSESGCFNLHSGDYTPMNGNWDDYLQGRTNLCIYSPRQPESDEKMPFYKKV